MSTLREQFSLIYDQYIEKIYRFVYLKVDSQEVAEDISSKVFVKCWESYQHRQIQNPRAFLYRIARNMVIDHYRSKDRTRVVSMDGQESVIDSGTNIHEMAVQNADIAMVKNALTKIKKDYQDVVIWHYLEDMSAKDIAEILDKPEGAVRVMIHRGLKALKDELEVSEG